MSNIEKPLELSEFTVSDTVPLLLLPLDHYTKALEFNLPKKRLSKNEDNSSDSNGLWRSWFSPSPTHCLKPFSSLCTGY
jgi:hypothetical protein